MKRGLFDIKVKFDNERIVDTKTNQKGARRIFKDLEDKFK